MQEVKIEAAKKRIEDKLKKRKELLIKLKKLNKIREKESVLRHLDLLSEINTLKNLLGGFSTSEIVHHEFNTNSLEDDNCPHDLWFYIGSFSSPGTLNGHFQNEVYLSDEEQKLLEGIPQDIPTYISELNQDIKKAESYITSLNGKID